MSFDYTSSGFRLTLTGNVVIANKIKRWVITVEGRTDKDNQSVSLEKEVEFINVFEVQLAYFLKLLYYILQLLVLLKKYLHVLWGHRCQAKILREHMINFISFNYLPGNVVRFPGKASSVYLLAALKKLSLFLSCEDFGWASLFVFINICNFWVLYRGENCAIWAKLG